MILEDYSHITLTEEELDEAILKAKIKKLKMYELEKIQEREQENRKRFNLYTDQFNYDQMRGLAMHRAMLLYDNNVFNKRFVIDDSNKDVFELLCLYFARDPRFEQFGPYSLDKGICIVGTPGVGKSWLMKIFSKNPGNLFT